MASMESILVCRERWLEAVSSGQPAAELVEETLRGCRKAVICLASQLVDLGYPVNEFLLPCPADLDERIARIEALTGVPVPKLIREFWRIVGGVAVVDLRRYKHVAFWDGLGINGAHEFCDGVYVDACDDDWLEYTANDFSNYADDRRPDPLPQCGELL